MLRAIRYTYGLTWRFMKAAPLIVLAIIAVEGAQHVAEWLTGMYASPEAAKAAQFHPARMAIGTVKTILLEFVIYWIARFALGGEDISHAFASDRDALRRFSMVILFTLVIGVAMQGIQALPMDGMSRALVLIVLISFMLGSLLLQVALTPWIVGAAVGDPKATPIFALRQSMGQLLRGFAFTLVIMLPPMIVHYVLGGLAIVRPGRLGMILLAADSIFVAFLGVLIAASSVTIAYRVARRRGYSIDGLGGAAQSIPALDGSGARAGTPDPQNSGQRAIES
ncbi:hypothetical protein [Sphingomonas sp.]|uniref:hypothetical protein n=1 Tax=Sphingomonas sp. TaxID=28214 RepID=UPI003D6CFFF0